MVDAAEAFICKNRTWVNLIKSVIAMVDNYILKLLVIGILLLSVTLGSDGSRMPVSYALIYLIVGIGLGPTASS